MRICPYDGNLEFLRAAFAELYSYEEIDEDMWGKILEIGQSKSMADLIMNLSKYDRVRCMHETSYDEFGLTEGFFSGDKWFADGVTAHGTVGCLIGDDTHCIVKGYDKQFELFTVSYLDDKDVPDVTVPALTEKPGDFVVGVPGLVGTYRYAILIMKKQEGN